MTTTNQQSVGGEMGREELIESILDAVRSIKADRERVKEAKKNMFTAMHSLENTEKEHKLMQIEKEMSDDLEL